MESIHFRWDRRKPLECAMFEDCTFQDKKHLLQEKLPVFEYYGNDETEIEIFPNFKVSSAS